MELVLPSVEYKNSFIEAVKEYQASTEASSRHKKYQQLSISELEADFDAFVERELSHSKGENLSQGYVSHTDYWLIDNDEFIGRVSVRHRLTEQLEKFDGHIGYDIRPSKRRQGYGSKILELVLPKVKELGIGKVLVTCRESNIASRKIIEKNGGILENKVHDPEAGVDKLRYWVDIE